MIKRISQPPVFFGGKDMISSAIYWPLRPEAPFKRTAKLSQERLPESLHSLPDEKGTKGGIQ